MLFLSDLRKAQIPALKLGGYFMYHRAYHLDVTHSVDIRCEGVLYETQNKQRLCTYTAITVWFFVTKERVYSTVIAESLYISLFKSRY
jgi:hypothetical protein